jgi:gas vesicle protein
MKKYGFGGMTLDTVFTDKPKSEPVSSSLNALIGKKSGAFKEEETVYTPSSKKMTANVSELKKLLMARGLNNEAAAGVLGSVEEESGFNSNAIGDKGTSYGLFQHHDTSLNKGRKTNLFNYAKKNNLDPSSYKTQVDFVFDEELSPNFVKRLNSAGVEGSARIWTKEIERPANVETKVKSRVLKAQNYLSYGGLIPKYTTGGNLTSLGLGYLSAGVDSFNTTDNPNVGLSALSGAAKGAAAGSAFGPIGTGVGAIVGGVTSIVQANKANQVYQENMRKENLATEQRFKNQSQSVLASYPTNGIQGQYGYFAYGGKIKKYNDGGEIKKEKSVFYPSDVSNKINTVVTEYEKKYGKTDSNFLNRLKEETSLRLTSDNIEYRTFPKNYDKSWLNTIHNNIKDLKINESVETLHNINNILKNNKINKSKMTITDGLKLIPSTVSYLDAYKIYKGFKSNPIDNGNGNGYTYGNGGKVQNPEYEVENKEVVQGISVELEGSKQIASDMHEAKGATHEQGGIKGKGGERVFSDRIAIPDDFKMLIQQAGIKVKDNSTFAAIAIELGKKKGLYEDKNTSHDYIRKNTGKLMLDKINGLIDLNFEVQEGMKNKVTQQEQTFAYGGDLKKMAYGDPIPKKANLGYPYVPENNVGFNYWDRMDSAFTKRINPFMTNSQKTVTDLVVDKPIIDVPKIDNFWQNRKVNPDYFIQDGAFNHNIRTDLKNTTYNRPIDSENPAQYSIVPNKIDIKPVRDFNLSSRIVDPKTLPGFSTARPLKSKFDINLGEDAFSYGISGLGYLNSMNNIRKIKTDVPQNMIDAPNFNYEDRSGLQRNQVASNFRTLIRNSKNPIGNQLAFANTIEQQSQIANNENQRRDNYISGYNDRAFRVNAANVQTTQTAQEKEIVLQNAKIEMKNDAGTSLLQNLNTAELQKNTRKLDYDKIGLARETANLTSDNAINYMVDSLKKKELSGITTTAEKQQIERLKRLGQW